MVVTRPGEPRRAFAHRNEAAYDNRLVTVITQSLLTFFIIVMINRRAIIGVLVDTSLGSDELKELGSIQLLIKMPVTVIQLKVTVGEF